MSMPFWWIKKPIGVEVKTVPAESELKILELSTPTNTLLELNAPNVQWQLLSGVMHHIYNVGGVDTVFLVKKGGKNVFCSLGEHLDATGDYAIDLRGGNIVIMREKYSMTLSGPDGCVVTLHVLQTAI